jgi:hypothetical protein
MLEPQLSGLNRRVYYWPPSHEKQELIELDSDSHGRSFNAQNSLPTYGAPWDEDFAPV